MTAEAGRLSVEFGGSYYHLIRANRIKFLEIFFCKMFKKNGVGDEARVFIILEHLNTVCVKYHGVSKTAPMGSLEGNNRATS